MASTNTHAGICTVSPLNGRSGKIHRRIGHITVKYKNYVIVWGGYEDKKFENEDHGHHRRPYYHPPNQLLLFDIEYEVWHIVCTDGDIPPKLCGSTAAVCGDIMYLFGGFCEEVPLHEHCNVRSLYELNLERMSWRQLKPAGLPPLPCDKLVSWCHDGAFYIFGGFGPWPEHVADYSDVTVSLAPHEGEQRCWNNQLARYRRRTGRWEWPAVDGVPPCPRAAHAAARVGDWLYLFGGRMGHRLNDFYCLDLKTMRWSQLEPEHPSGPVPQGRSWHSLTPLLSDQLLLYGGFSDEDEPLADPWIWDVAGRQWVSARSWLRAPPVRMWHAAAYGAPGEVLVVGGLETSIFLDPARCASQLVVVRRTPKSLLRLCLDVLERWRADLTPDVWLLPLQMVDRVMARLMAAGS